MITYNHERCISESIESVLMQKTDFNLKIVIGEDNSTANTREIAKNYAKLYPAKIHLTLNAKNLGITKMFLTFSMHVLETILQFLKVTITGPILTNLKSTG